MPEGSVSLAKTVPVNTVADVCVCGAGPAGWIAAVSAARNGMKTVLVDRLGFPGGTATSGYVLPISGFYFKGTRVAGNIAFEFAERLERAGGAIFEMPKGNISFDPEYYKLVAEEMLDEAGVVRITNSYICDCLTSDGGTVDSVVYVNKGGFSAVRAGFFIDATGDADLCLYAGMPMQPHNPEMQPLSSCFLLSGVDTSTDLLRDSIHHNGMRRSVNQKIREFLLSQPDLPEFCGPWFNTAVRGGHVVVNVTRAGCDATDPDAYAEAEKRLRRDIFRIVALLRSEYPEFARAEIAASAFNAGIRETRRILGRYTFTGEDLLTGRKLPCPVAGCAHPVDIHRAGGAAQTLVSLDNPSFIPYDSLTADGYPNLIAAGRCISTDPVAFASIRVQGTCMTVGEAAGKAAAFALDRRVPAFDLAAAGFRAL